MNITLLGCGLMGTPMTRRLLQAGYPVTVWNRTPAKAEALVADGAICASTPAKACANADIVITMLEHGGVVESVMWGAQGAAHGMLPGSLHIDMSSILPAQARAHAQRMSTHGLHSLDAPVSGGTLGAEAGTLAIMAGGQTEHYARATAVLSALGRPVHVGPHGAGQLAKLANQMIVGITIGAVAEALLMVEKGGANPEKVREALRGGFAESRILEVHGQRMVEQDFQKRGSLAIQLKDMQNAVTTASEMGFSAPITDALRDLYDAAADHGLAELDQSALYLELKARQAG